MCTLDTQIKRSGLRISDYKVFSSVRSNHLSLKNKRFGPSVCKCMGIRKFETQFICNHGKFKKDAFFFFNTKNCPNSERSVFYVYL